MQGTVVAGPMWRGPEARTQVASLWFPEPRPWLRVFVLTFEPISHFTVFLKEDLVLQMFRNLPSLKRTGIAAAAIAAVAALGLSASPAQAEFEEGDWELRLSGFAENDVNFDGVIASVNATGGYFFTDQFEAGVRQSFVYSDLAGSNLSGQTTIFINYHFGGQDAALQPFIGASVGYQYGDAVPDLFLGGPEAGITYFFDESWFLFAEVQYLFYFEDVDAADESFDDGEFNWGLGLGVIIDPNS